MDMATEVEQPLGLIPNDFVGTPGSSSDVNSAMITVTTPGSAAPLKQTPSPVSIHNPTSTATTKRPSRKSTLTQQQKNQKRQRATQDQLATLELEFNKNPTPTALVRERIAEEINMTERSVQIWFQNRYANEANVMLLMFDTNLCYRRAKIKNMAKKSLETGEDFDSIPESMRAYLAMQAMESGKGLGVNYFGRPGISPYGHGNMMMGGDINAQGKVLINHLTCRSLSIGKWTRVGQNAMDLIVFYSPDKCTITYYIHNEQAGYKIEYPFSYVKNIYLDNNEGDPNKLGGIVIELNRPPHFFMDLSNNTTTGFSLVSDFTEDRQATECLVHHLGGNPKVLSGQLAKLVSLDAFMNRHTMHNPHAFHDPHSAVSMSAPVSPQARPSSQPSFPPQQMSMFNEPPQWGMNQMHSGMRPQGHKRQRSRSVPGPVDFAMFQNQPMPSFYIQPPGEMAPPPAPHNPTNLYHPMPQQPHPAAANLRIDTQAGFGLDMRQYPMSATTASPSEFPPSPGFFPHPQDNGPIPTSNYNAAFNHGYLSPMPGHENQQGQIPATSMPYQSPTEPSIVEQSPPMNMMGRPGSADMYAGSCAVSEDGSSLNEMYSKHTIHMPMHQQSPGQMHHHQNELDMDSLVQFDTVDGVGLSPDAGPSQQ